MFSESILQKDLIQKLADQRAFDFLNNRLVFDILNGIDHIQSKHFVCLSILKGTVQQDLKWVKNSIN